MSRLLVSRYSHRGAVRDHNEDRQTYRHFTHRTGNYELLAVADGMGGHERGEVAAQLALQSIEEFLAFGVWTDQREALVRAFEIANSRVHDEGGGMGTTLVAVLVEVETLRTWVANVGDSRAYIVHTDGSWEPLTRDHSAVAARVEAGLLTREEAESVEGRNVLLRAIGPDPEVEVDVFPGQLREGERLLLCSDGLHSMLPERQFMEMAAKCELGSDPAKLLSQAAIEAGGRDNVTVILAAPATEETVRMGSFPAPARIRRPGVLPLRTLAASVFVVGVGVAAAGFLHFARGDNGTNGHIPTAVLDGGASTTPEISGPLTPTATATSLPAATKTAPPTPSPAPTSTFAPTPTATPTPSPTPTSPTPTPTASPIPSPTPTLDPSSTPSATQIDAVVGQPKLGVRSLQNGLPEKVINVQVEWSPPDNEVDLRSCVGAGCDQGEAHWNFKPGNSGGTASLEFLRSDEGEKVCVEIAPAKSKAWTQVRCLTLKLVQ